MRLTKTLIPATLLALSFGSTHAADSTATKIEMIRGFNATTAKGLYLDIEAALPNPAGCTITTWARASSAELADFDQQFSMLLAAHMAGRDVVVQIHDTVCSNGYPFLINVYVY